ncbi:MAG: protein kinase [Deltaproteobacteria bacterium]|nr:protein kinase [Deltaproteobacteria bacterium]
MDALLELFAEPLNVALALGGIAVLLVIIRVVKNKRQAPKKPKVDSKVQRYLKAGNFEAAANFELKNNNPDNALDYFLQAQKPMRAAQVAQRMDQPKMAAELYERAGDMERAIAMYKAAGLDRKAGELARNKETAEALKEEEQTLGPEEDQLLTPLDRARRTESRFCRVREKAASGDPDAGAQLESVGRETVEALLTAGETRRAAEICIDAGLFDQAINLYVNLLGDPGAAAPLLSKRGDHKRAAELYEAAGKKERAFSSWMEWTKKATDPLLHLNQVERLGKDTVYTILESILEQRPLDSDNVDLHYRIADAYEKREKAATAVALLEQILKISPAYRDAEQKVSRMKVVLEDGSAGASLGTAKTELGSGGLGTPVLDKEDVRAKNADIGTAKTLVGSDTSDLVEADDPFASLMPGPVVDTSSDSPMAPDQLMESAAIEQLVSEVAQVAAQQAASLARAERPSTIPVAPTVELPDAPPGRRPAGRTVEKRLSTSQVRGLERIAVTLQYVDDPIVVEAKAGPPATQLVQMISGKAPDLQNIELFYRLGLAHAAAGQWTDALGAFKAVQEVSPGYRDAEKRADELGRWQDSVPEIVTGKSLVSDEKSQRYKLLGKLGAGGMAVVYRARDEALERDVALKFLSEDISSNEKMLEMFKREARAAAQLNHSNIVTVFDVGVLGGRNFICMELISGTTVEEMLEQSGSRLRVLDALRITESVLNALDYAHSKKIIHRDIKPSNIMSNDLGVVKLMDFGLAKSIEGKAKTTMIAGTPNYMPPEQFTGKGMDGRSDLFAVGASLFEMLAGFPPFDGMVRADPPMMIREINPTVPKLLETTVARSMEFDMDKRFQSAKHMLRPLRQILTSVSSFISRQTSLPAGPIA